MTNNVDVVHISQRKRKIYRDTWNESRSGLKFNDWFKF